MAIFSDNDRSKVDDEIKIDDVDEIVEDDDDQDDDQDDSTNNDDDQDSSKKVDDQDDDQGGKKDKTNPEETAEYWKKKFADSSREAQILAEREKEAKQKLEEATKPKEITDDVMKQQYPDWDNYDEAVKAALKGQAQMSQELTELKKQSSEYHNERKWQGKIDSFLSENDETEKYGIKDKDGFRKFCNKPERKGMDLDILAAAFVYEVGSKQPVESKKKNKGSMLESGSGQGATKKHSSDKKEYTAEDAKRLRENNPKEYERLVRSGKLDIKI